MTIITAMMMPIVAVLGVAINLWIWVKRRAFGHPSRFWSYSFGHELPGNKPHALMQGLIRAFVLANPVVYIAFAFDSYRSAGMRGAIRSLSHPFDCAFGPIVAGLLMFCVVLPVAVATRALARTLERSLEGANRLEGWLTFAGIVVFLVGNFLQFAATFHPR